MSLSAEYLHGIDNADTTSPADSDEDLELDELDPENESSRQSFRGSRDYGRRTRGYGARIALRNLRTGVRHTTWDGDAARQSEDDLDGLLDDHEDTVSRRNADDAPLLDSRRRSQVSLIPDETGRSNKSRLSGLRGLISGSGPSASPLSSDEDRSKPAREVLVGQQQLSKFPANIVSNAKYTPWSFLPRTLYNEFSFFFNLYFLLVALSQIIPVLRIGYTSSYIAPLAFVVSISLGKEAWDDIGRRRRDAEANSEEYTVLSFGNPAFDSRRRHPARFPRPEPNEDGIYEVVKKSRDLKVGDVLKIRKDQRLPADVVILQSTPTESATSHSTTQDGDRPAQEQVPDLLEPVAETTTADNYQPSQQTSSSETTGTSDTFIRTDQLDGETDWKLRVPPSLSQNLALRDLRRLRILAGAPDRRVNEFVGTMELDPSSYRSYDPPVNKPQSPREELRASEDNASQVQSVPLTIENTAWANTVLASNTITLAAIIYTGPETRSALSTSPSRSKVGLLEYEINNLTKILCAVTLLLSVTLVALEGFQPTNDKEWYIAILIYLILFSTIIPMSLRVNLDMAKTVYARFIERDRDIPGTVVRTSTIPEDLGRIEYLLSDKTGTLTQNGRSTHTSEFDCAHTNRNRDGAEEDPCGNRFLRERSNGRGLILCKTRVCRDRAVVPCHAIVGFWSPGWTGRCHTDKA